MAKAVWTNQQIIGQLDSGYEWSGLNLTYGFPTSASWFPYSEKSTATALTSTQQTAATLAIKLWDDLMAPDFTLAANGATANVKYMNTTTDIGYAHAYYPGSYTGAGSVWFNSQYGASSGTNNLMSPTVGAWGWSTFVHETGHALGLDHPGTYNGGSPTYANDALYAQDSQMYTIMSYFTASNTGADWVASDGRTYYAQTPMLHDVMSIQAMYGIETTTRVGDTVYGFHATADAWIYNFTVNLHPVLCIWDSAGNDTLDLSGWSTSCVINLAPGSFSSADMMTYNISIAYSCVVENGLGGGGADTIAGNDIGNMLYGLLGDDMLTGAGGNDVIDGGGGNDTAVYSGTRANYLVTWNAATGVFTLTDTRVGSADGSDQVKDVEQFRFADGIVSAANLLSGTGGTGGGGGTGTTGTAGVDALVGTASADQMYGYAGNDTLTGYAGNDLLNGGSGTDTMTGGTGNDTYVVDASGDVVIELANQGTDLVQTTVASYVLGNNVENLTYAGGVGFTGTGNGVANVITGGAGADALYGQAGNDTLLGNGGDDRLDGGVGSDTMRGGVGNDTYVVDASGDVVTEFAGEGIDLALTTLAMYTLTSEVENLTYTGAGSFTGTGNGLANVVTGGAGADTLYGQAGNDTLVGNAGNDWLDGGAGSDTMRGGAGNDTYRVDSAADTVTELANDGTDLVYTTLASQVLGANIENLTYSGSSAFAGTGNELANVIRGGSAADVLSGGAGNDTLYGNNGNDVLIGGAGRDWLVGGRGADIFRILALSDSAGAGSDVISDFYRREGDKIDLSAIDAKSSTLANDAFAFIGASGFTGVSGQLRYASGTLSGDVNGDRVADFSVSIANYHALSAYDFVL